MSNRPVVLTAVILAMLLAAIEATIVATAMPDIAASLGGFALYGWVFSAYLLMQAVTTPLFGKLADLYGRKPVFLTGVGIFLLGSVACALSHSMPMLVMARFVQGTGAGAVLPISVTLAGDLYTLEERGRVQAYLSSVWGISSVVGPLAGGLIVENAGWPWIFWLNVPVGLLSCGLMVAGLREQVERRRTRLDWMGAGLLLFSLAALLLALTLGGAAGAGLLVLAVLCGGLFLRQERRAEDPVVHLELWSEAIVWRGNLTVLMVGVGMLGLLGYMPTFVQGVLGRSALVAGFALSSMCIGWPLSSVTAGRLLPKISFRPIVRTGGVMAALGALEIALWASRGPVWAGIGCFLVGVGFGLLNTSFIVAIQTSVGWEKRGMATAGNMLMRNLGNALGAAAMGALLNHHLRGYLEKQGLADRVSVENVRDLVGSAQTHLDRASFHALQDGLSASLHLVFWGVFASVVLAALCAWNAPNVRLGHAPAEAAPEA